LIFISGNIAEQEKFKMKRHSIYFTRLTPNFKNWQNPSGNEGKCKCSNPKTPLYEEQFGFGWEEWMLEDYFEHMNELDFTCSGFVQALNQKNEQIDFINRLYLYTKICKNKYNKVPGYYYIGYIDNITRLQYAATNAINKKICTDLKNVGIINAISSSMLPNAKNISFKVKDVHINFPLIFNQTIRLNRGQFRFSLYEINKHPNFLTQL
jgi:hypothetical protein